MHRNVARAYDALWAEHERIRRGHMKVLSQGDRQLERCLLRANPDDKPITTRFFFTKSGYHVLSGGALWNCVLTAERSSSSWSRS
jgi:hypothetical protein